MSCCLAALEPGSVANQCVRKDLSIVLGGRFEGLLLRCSNLEFEQFEETHCVAGRAPRSALVVEQAEPKLQVDELPEEHHVVFADLGAEDDSLVLVDQFVHARQVVDAALAE